MSGVGMAAILLMRAVERQRPDLRVDARSKLVASLIASGDARVDRNGVLVLTDAGRAALARPKPDAPPAPPPKPDTSELQAKLAAETNPNRRAMIRAQIGRANGVTSTKENP